jgi:hypothetical protein
VQTRRNRKKVEKPANRIRNKPISVYLTEQEKQALAKMIEAFNSRMKSLTGQPFEVSQTDFIRRLIETYGQKFASGD